MNLVNSDEWHLVSQTRVASSVQNQVAHVGTDSALSKSLKNFKGRDFEDYHMFNVFEQSPPSFSDAPFSNSFLFATFAVVNKNFHNGANGDLASADSLSRNQKARPVVVKTSCKCTKKSRPHGPGLPKKHLGC